MLKTWRSTVLETMTWNNDNNPCPLTTTTTKLYLLFKLEFRFQSHSSKVSASQRSAPCSLQESYSLTQVHICHLIILDYMTSSFFFKYKLNWFPLGQGQPLVLLGNQLVCEGMQTLLIWTFGQESPGVFLSSLSSCDYRREPRVGQVPCAALTALEVT